MQFIAMINTKRHLCMSNRKNNIFLNIPIYLWLFLFFSCTDLYIVSGIKVVYIFSIFLVIILFKRGRVIFGKENKFLLMWYASYFLAIGHVVSNSDFLTILIGQIVLIIIFFYFQGMKSIQMMDKIEKWFQTFLYFTVFVGVIQLLLYYCFGSVWGISHLDHGVMLPRMRGLTAEPDWYGLICAISFCYMIFNRIQKKIYHSKNLDGIITVVSFSMMIFSMTRAAWVGFAAGVIVFFIMFNDVKIKKIKRKIIKYTLFALPFILVIVFILAATNNPIFTKTITRLNPVLWLSTEHDGGAAGSRLMSITIMWDYFLRHPITGNGVGGMGMLSDNKTVLESFGFFAPINNGRGSANLILNCLFDTGIIGTLFFTLFIISVYKKLNSAYKYTRNLDLLKYIIIITVFLVDFQFNNGIRLTYVWIILGIACCYARLYKEL